MKHLMVRSDLLRAATTAQLAGHRALGRSCAARCPPAEPQSVRKNSSFIFWFKKHLYIACIQGSSALEKVA